MDVVLAQEHGAASKGCDGALGRHAGAGAPLAEGHGDGLASQGGREVGPAVAGLDVCLVFPSIPHEGGELGGSEVGNGEQVSGRKGRYLGGCWRAGAGVGAALQLPQAADGGAEGRHGVQWDGVGSTEGD